MKKQSQNKPNLLDAQMNISSVLTKDYENVPLRRRGENKPNQTQFSLAQIPQFNHPDSLSYKIFFTAIGLKKPKIHLSRMVYLFEKVFLFSKYSRI